MSEVENILEVGDDNTAGLFFLTGDTLAVLSFAIGLLADPEVWIDYPDEQLSDSQQEAIDTLIANASYEISNQVDDKIYPEHFNYSPLALFQVTGAITRSVGTVALTQSVITVTPPADTTILGFRVFLREGRYDWTFVGVTSNNKCKMTPTDQFGQIEAPQIDWYSASAVANVLKTITVDVLSSGEHIVYLYCNDKNASSSNYDVNLSQFWGVRTGDIP